MKKSFLVAAAILACLSKASSAAVLQPNQQITAGQAIYSDNRQYYLALQHDGNLCMYTAAGQLVFNAQTQGKGGTRLVMQGDGTLVFYTASNESVWQITTNRAGSTLNVQDDGNLVVYYPKALWHSNTADAANIQTNQSYVLAPGSSFQVGQTYTLGQYQLTFQSDANLVLYKNGGNAIWHTRTNGSGATRAVVQNDGNFCLYPASGPASWCSQTGNHPGAYLAFQPDGNLVIYGMTAFWSRQYGYARLTDEVNARPSRPSGGMVWVNIPFR
jgi:hypothetical protein